ncbi:MAG: zinc-dependent alcohol dehydrogenase [Nocardioidaceae bacterium]
MPQVIRFVDRFQVDVAEYDAPPLLPATCRVSTLYSGISAGTELTAYRGTNPYLTSVWDPDLRLFSQGEGAAPAYPLEGWGYSEVGEVVEIADDVTSIEVGQRVWGIWGHRSEVVLPAAPLAAKSMSPDVDPVLGSFVRVGAIALNAVLAARVSLGETVVVMGQGVIGLLATSFAVRSGADVVVVDPIASRRDRGLAMGAASAVAPGESVARAIRERTRGRGADAVIELSGSHEALHEALRIAGPDARVTAAGFYQGGAGALRLGEEFHHNRVQLVASQIGSLPPHLHHRWDRGRLEATTLDMVSAGRPDVARLVSHRFAVHEADQAYELLDRSPADALQVLIDFTKE